MTTLPIGTYTNVMSSLTPTAVEVTDFGRTLLLTTDPEIDPTDRVHVYTRLEDLITALGSSSPAATAATAYFSQTPRPKPLVCGRWVETGFGGYVVGGTPASLSTIQAITAGALTFDGQTLTGVTFSAATSFAQCRHDFANPDSRYCSRCPGYGDGGL